MNTSKTKLILTLAVDYDLDGESAEALKEQLRGLIDHAVSNGQLSGDTAAMVDSWDMRVDELPYGNADDCVNTVPGMFSWLMTLPQPAYVYIDDGGLSLRCLESEDAYLEIGGHTPDDKED